MAAAIMAFAICETVIDLYFAGVRNEKSGSVFSRSHGVCCEPMIIAGRKMLTIAGPLASARALEGLTAVIVNVNKRYRAHAGLRVTGVS